MLDAAMERLSGAAHSIAQEVVSSRLRDHPNNKGRAVVGSIFSTSADAHRAEREALARRLQRRPTMEELTEKGIVPVEAKGGVSPALAGSMHSLKRQRVADTIDRSLQRRPTMEDLAQKGIVRDPSQQSGPIVEGAKMQLKRRQTSEALRSGLQRRPSMEELRARGILPGVFAAWQPHEPEVRAGIRIPNSRLRSCP